MSEITTPGAALALYQAMSEVATLMLAAARAENWDLLVELETVRAAHGAELQRMQVSAEMTLQQRERSATLMRQMLADDDEIRTLAAARMVQLSHLMDDASTQRKLSKAYEA